MSIYKCNCGGKFRVIATRACDEYVYRIRKCEECDYKFTTQENIIDGGIPNWVQKIKRYEYAERKQSV